MGKCMCTYSYLSYGIKKVIYKRPENASGYPVAIDPFMILVTLKLLL